MSKKHFKLLAAVMLEIKPDRDISDWQNACSAIASVCAMTNPRFDRDRFLRACGVIE